MSETRYPELDPGSLDDERGYFGVRVVLQADCEERVESRWTSLRTALTVADSTRRLLGTPWADPVNARAHVLVDVVDLDDPERGSLDDEEPSALFMEIPERCVC